MDKGVVWIDEGVSERRCSPIVCPCKENDRITKRIFVGGQSQKRGIDTIKKVFDDNGFLGYSPHWAVYPLFHAGKRETELKPTTFSFLLFFPIFRLSSSLDPTVI